MPQTKTFLLKSAAVSSVHDEQKKAEMLCSKVKTRMNELREYVDELEGLVDDELWPMPKFLGDALYLLINTRYDGNEIFFNH